jgi:hypothetical protein
MPSSTDRHAGESKSRLKEFVLAMQHAIARFARSCCLIRPSSHRALLLGTPMMNEFNFPEVDAWAGECVSTVPARHAG